MSGLNSAFRRSKADGSSIHSKSNCFDLKWSVSALRHFSYSSPLYFANGRMQMPTFIRLSRFISRYSWSKRHIGSDEAMNITFTFPFCLMRLTIFLYRLFWRGI